MVFLVNNKSSVRVTKKSQHKSASGWLQSCYTILMKCYIIRSYATWLSYIAKVVCFAGD